MSSQKHVRVIVAVFENAVCQSEQAEQRRPSQCPFKKMDFITVFRGVLRWSKYILQI
jgi:hypothetical protein